MRELVQLRIPWSKAKDETVHYEFNVESTYGELGECKSIMEIAPGHYEAVFEDKFISYIDGAIAVGYVNSSKNEDKK